MTHTIGNVAFGQIKNVRKSGDEDGVYFADVEISEGEGFPFEEHLYCARSDDKAITGRWVYEQITTGNIIGVVQQLTPNTDPVTGEAWPEVGAVVQPISTGAQSL